MRESTVEKYLKKRVEEIGGQIRKVEWIGRRGAPDRLVMLPSRSPLISIGRVVWVECKRPKKDAEAHQAREHELMRSFGQTVLVIDTRQKVDEFLAVYMA